MTLRVVYAGTPAFAVPALAALCARHTVAGVLTQPDRPAGRGRQMTASPVREFATQQGLPVLQPVALRGADSALDSTLAQLAEWRPDVMVVVAYGLILPKATLKVPRFGCFNIHASLLPRWRGAAPIQRAIMAGDAETGVAIMRIEEGLDTGAVCLAERTPIWPDETAGELHDRLAALGAGLMVKALGDLGKGSLACWPQHGEGVTYAAKIEAGETRIDWSRPAAEVQYQIQGLSPHPGAWFEIELARKRERIRALRATLAEGEGKPGTLLDGKLTIACGKGAVRVTQVQRAGKRPMGAEDFLRGAALRPGSVLD